MNWSAVSLQRQGCGWSSQNYLPISAAACCVRVHLHADVEVMELHLSLLCVNVIGHQYNAVQVVNWEAVRVYRDEIYSRSDL